MNSVGEPDGAYYDKRAAFRRPFVFVVKPCGASLRQYRKRSERAKYARTGVIARSRTDVVLERKLQRVSFARGKRPLGYRAKRRAGAERSTAGRRVIDRRPVELDGDQVAIGALRP